MTMKTVCLFSLEDLSLLTKLLPKNCPPQHFILLLMLLLQKEPDCFSFINNNTGQKMALCNHLVYNSNVKTHRKGVRLPT